MKKYVLRFQISVQNFEFIQYFIRAEYIPHIFHRLTLTQFPIFLQFLIQISTIAIFIHKIMVILSFDKLMKSNNVVTCSNFRQYFHFVEQAFFGFRVVEQQLVLDHFYCELTRSIAVSCFEYFTWAAFAHAVE